MLLIFLAPYWPSSGIKQSEIFECYSFEEKGQFVEKAVIFRTKNQLLYIHVHVHYEKSYYR